MTKDKLTKREREVIDLVSHGMSAKQVAHVLKVSPHTVREYCARVRVKLDCKNTTQACCVAIRLRIIASFAIAVILPMLDDFGQHDVIMRNRERARRGGASVKTMRTSRSKYLETIPPNFGTVV